MKILTKIWNFIIWHPIWSMIISWFIFYFINTIVKGPCSLGSCYIITAFIYLILSGTIKKARKKSREQRDEEPLTRTNFDKNKYEIEREWYQNSVIKEREPVPEESNTIGTNNEIDYKNSYEARYLLTKNEWYQYNTLKKAADEKGYIVCPKVRLLDVIQPRKGSPKYKTLFYKIQSKHVDFVICGPDLRIKAVIEIDDNSHNAKKRKERDMFVDMILTSVGYKVIHTNYISNDILKEI